uniref:NADH dehydrogenase subunit 6 n=1 Tax=Pilargis verrucosa TaxID=1818081 RepID=UPI0030E3734C
MTLATLMSLTCAITFSMFMSSAPLTLGMWVLMLALLMASFISLTLHSWLSLLLFLIYIGGLLVMFAYFSAIQPNQHMELHKMMSAFISTLIILDFQMDQISLNPAYLNQPALSSITTIYSFNNIMVLILLASILFLALVAVVKISQNLQGPLRPFM